MSAADISIENWHNEIGVARNHPDPLRARDHIDKLTRHAPIALGRALESYLSRKNGEVILVRSLDLDMDLDTDCDLEQASRVLAKQMTHRLVEQIESAAPTVVRFASEAAYRARFIEDLANGRAWGQWYYKAFEGLQMLPASCAIRSVLVDDPDVGRETLAAISFDAWRAVGSVLDGADSARVVNALAEESAELDGAALFDELTRVAVSFSQLRALNVPTLALTLIAALHGRGLSCTPLLIHAAEIAAALLTAHRANDRPTLRALLDKSGMHFETALFRCVPHLVRATNAAAMSDLARGVLAEISAASHSSQADAHESLESYETPFAGLVVLLDEVDRFLAGHTSNKGALALMVLACIAGKQRRNALWQDSAWRSILGVDANLTGSDFLCSLSNPNVALEDSDGALDRSNTALEHPNAETPSPIAWRRFIVSAARTVCRRFARRIPGMQGASMGYLRANFLMAHGRCERLEPNRYRMRIAKPPLHVLLTLTGIGRGSRTWHGTEATQIDIEYL